jgi:preprotein translocase subunit SecY
MLAKSLEGANPTNPMLGRIADTIAKHDRMLVPEGGLGYLITAIFVITAGTMLLMWLGEQITERGIGNGISLIISVNIVSALPGALVQAWDTFIKPGDAGGLSPVILVMLIAFLLAVIAAVIAITQAQRRIPVNYAKRVVGRKVYGGQNTFLPLKVNYAGVMPIIFAQAILLFPTQILEWIGVGWAKRLSSMLGPDNWIYYLISALLIFFFSYFWVATMFQPNQIAEDLRKNGGYIPGVRPGKPTADYLDFTMSRLTFAGAIFLTVVAILPTLLSMQLRVPGIVTQFFGGTSILILVGVLLDVMRQVETHLLQRHYDGFLRKGKIRGRFDRQTGGGKTANPKTVLLLWVLAGILMIVGVAYSIYTTTR